MLCDQGSAALRNCPFVRDRSCRRGNCGVGSCAETSNSRVAGLGQTRKGRSEIQPRMNTDEGGSVDVLPRDWRAFGDGIVARRGITGADILRLAVNADE